VIFKHKAKAYEGIEILFNVTHSDDGEWAVSRSGHFTTAERTAVIHFMGFWMGPTAIWRQQQRENLTANNRIPFA
jgi:hypothetical protein